MLDEKNFFVLAKNLQNRDNNECSIETSTAGVPDFCQFAWALSSG